MNRRRVLSGIVFEELMVAKQSRLVTPDSEYVQPPTPRQNPAPRLEPQKGEATLGVNYPKPWFRKSTVMVFEITFSSG